MSLWDVILIIGVLLIANGIFITQQQFVTAKVDRKVRSSAREIVYGSHKGLLFLTDTQIWMTSTGSGNLGKAYVVRSGIFQAAKSLEYDFNGKNINTLNPDELDIPSYVAGACKVARRNYSKLMEYERRKRGYF